MKIRVIVNRGGGSFDGDRAAGLKDLFAAQGADADVRLTEPEALEQAFADAAEASGIDAVAAAGGDGTISAAAGALAGKDRALGILPFGTLNHLARDAGIPGDLAEAVAVIAAGRARQIDVAEVNGRVFVNNSALGLYPFMVREREAQQRRLGRSKRLAMLWASLKALGRFPRHRLAVRIAGRQDVLETVLLFIGNNKYDTSSFTLGQREAIDQGALCLYAVLARTRWQLLSLALRGLIGRLERQGDFLTLDGIREVEIDSRQPLLHIAVDGETERLAPPLHYRIRPGALRLLVP